MHIPKRNLLQMTNLASWQVIDMYVMLVCRSYKKGKNHESECERKKEKVIQFIDRERNKEIESNGRDRGREKKRERKREIDRQTDRQVVRLNSSKRERKRERERERERGRERERKKVRPTKRVTCMKGCKNEYGVRKGEVREIDL